MSHPRSVELVLDGLIGDPATKDALLGDLLEEWAERVERSGVHSANWWYCLQAFRETPGLITEWCRETPWLVLVGIAFTAILVRLLTLFGGVVALGFIAFVLRAADAPVWAATTFASMGTAAVAFAGGAVIVRIFKDTPVPAMLWLTFLVLITTVSLDGVVTNGFVAAWYLVSDKLLSVPATFAGGLVAMRQLRGTLRVSA